MAGEKHTYSRISSSGEDFQNLLRYAVRILDLTQNSNLHVVNKQRDSLRMAYFFKCSGNVNAGDAPHVRQVLPVMDVYGFQGLSATSLAACEDSYR